MIRYGQRLNLQSESQTGLRRAFVSRLLQARLGKD
jgi:hypothetical protein